MKKYLLIATLAFCLTACSKKQEIIEESKPAEVTMPVETTVAPTETQPIVEEVVVEDKQLNVKFDLNTLSKLKDNKEIIKAEYTPIEIVDEEYNDLNNVLNIYNELTWKELKELYEENVNWIEEESIELDESFYIKNRINVERADNKILSFINIENAYLGGAHDSFYISAKTFDSENGNALELKDVVTNYDKIYSLVLENIENNYEKEDLFEDYKQTLENMFYHQDDEFTGELEWTLDYNGITFYFSPYTLGPWSSGSIIINIPIKENPELFNDKYLYEIEYPIEKVYLNTPVKLGEEDSDIMLELTATANTDEFKSAIFIRKYNESEERSEEVKDKDKDKNEKQTEDENEEPYLGEIYSEEFNGIYHDSYLVYTRFEKPFLYIEFTHENDYRTLEIFDISESDKNVLQISHVKSLNVGIHNNYIADPDDFKLYSRVDLLGTYMGYKSYNSGRNGVPETADELFTLIGENILTTKKDFDILVYGENSNIIERKLLKSGSSLKLLKTDGKTMIEAELEDGRICKILIEKYDNVCYVNGMSEYNLFKDLPYAG